MNTFRPKIIDTFKNYSRKQLVSDLIAGLIVVPVVSLLTPKMNKESVEKMFACYEETVVIKKKHSLEARK